MKNREKPIKSLVEIKPGSILVDYEDTIFMILQVELDGDGIDIHHIEGGRLQSFGRINDTDLRSGYFKFL